MTVHSVLYASRSTIPLDQADEAISALVHVSQLRNMAAGVTGCLIFGGGKFAQALEGDEKAVEEIMRSICRDPRHTDVTILEKGPIDIRRFADWALGYAGSSMFVHRSIAKPVAAALRASNGSISDLVRMMTEFRNEQAASHD